MKRFFSTLILASIYLSSLFFSKAFKRFSGRKKNSSRVILVVATFHNPNWFYSHILPLTRSGIDKIILVCDSPVAQLDNVVYSCPPKFLSKLLSRALAKFVWAIISGLRYNPCLYMGYHIFPAAVSALIAARIFNKKACYQVTSGPLELEGGGWHAENKLLVSLGRPSKVIELLAFKVVNEFDFVVVRGSRAETFIRKTGYKNRLGIIPGSVQKYGKWKGFLERDIDLIFVGRLTEYKRPDRFISALAVVAKALPDIRAVIVGEGPDKQDLMAQVIKKGLQNNVTFMGKKDNVPELLAKSKLYILTSRWEGVSIAMMEAMSVGAVPVVADVGDLRDLVRNGQNGFIVPENSIDEFSDKIQKLLFSVDMWEDFSRNAVREVLEFSGIDAVAHRWKINFDKLF